MLFVTFLSNLPRTNPYIFYPTYYTLLLQHAHAIDFLYCQQRILLHINILKLNYWKKEEGKCLVWCFEYCKVSLTWHSLWIPYGVVLLEKKERKYLRFGICHFRTLDHYYYFFIPWNSYILCFLPSFCDEKGQDIKLSSCLLLLTFMLTAIFLLIVLLVLGLSFAPIINFSSLYVHWWAFYFYF
jgi:hypothetical protein